LFYTSAGLPGTNGVLDVVIFVIKMREMVWMVYITNKWLANRSINTQSSRTFSEFSGFKHRGEHNVAIIT
jgi:hypothetical protein